MAVIDHTTGCGYDYIGYDYMFMILILYCQDFTGVECTGKYSCDSAGIVYRVFRTLWIPPSSNRVRPIYEMMCFR